MLRDVDQLMRSLRPKPKLLVLNFPHNPTTAVVEPGAQLGAGVEVGALAYVGAGVMLGDGTRLRMLDGSGWGTAARSDRV